MSKTEYAWVIQRDDGMYFCGWDLKNTACFTENIYRAICNTWSFFEFSPATERSCRIGIAKHNLQNCRPVKVKIEIVGEDDE